MSYDDKPTPTRKQRVMVILDALEQRRRQISAGLKLKRSSVSARARRVADPGRNPKRRKRVMRRRLEAAAKAQPQRVLEAERFARSQEGRALARKRRRDQHRPARQTAKEIRDALEAKRQRRTVQRLRERGVRFEDLCPRHDVGMEFTDCTCRET